MPTAGMEKFMRPERFDGHQGTSAAQWKHWHRTFSNFLTKCGELSQSDKLELLINHISPDVFENISDCENYDSAIDILKSLYIKPVNRIFARYQLSTRKQLSHESLDQFLQSLRSLAKDCEFQSLTQKQRTEMAIMDAFISGLNSNVIRQRLLENGNLTLETAFQQARTLDLAQQNAESYSSVNLGAVASTDINKTGLNPDVYESRREENNSSNSTAGVFKSKCMFCGNTSHPRRLCPAKEVTCFKCSKKGHFSKVCRSPSISEKPMNNVASTLLASVCDKKVLGNSTSYVNINGVQIKSLFDSGSFASFMRQDVAERLDLAILKSKELISMASSSLTAYTVGHCLVDIKIDTHSYQNIRLNILSNLCTEVILGRDFLNKHTSVEFKFEGDAPKLTICSVTEMLIEPATLFSALSENCIPVKAPSRKFSVQDKTFISEEVDRLLKEGVIEESVSPWRAQVLVAGGNNHKKRLVVDYSQTINKYTQLEGYPLPRIDDLVQKLANNRYFSTIDLKSAYHQIPLRKEDRYYTAFEADGRLFQFTRIPFGLTNAVPVFQRQMDRIIKSNQLKKTHAYLDDIIISGDTKEEHNLNLEAFLAVAEKLNITINKEKSKFFHEEINYLGHTISRNCIKPDENRLKPLRDIKPPDSKVSLQKTLGLFSYYAKWISNYSTKINPLLNVCKFPLSRDQVKAFEDIREEICRASMSPINELATFEVETDASDTAIASVLSQNGRPVAFYSRSLCRTEKLYPAIEKEALSIVEAVRHWRHFLLPKPFRVITDQRAVSFMFNKRQKSKIKNDKVLRWRLELSYYQYDISYRPGSDNVSADALSRLCGSICKSVKDLEKLHNSLCHPGISRLTHFVRSKNLPFSVEDIKKVCLSCPSCAKIKPRFYKPPNQTLVKATRPFERLSLDFMGPKSSFSKNRYLLVIIDEFSRFPFVYPCADLSSKSVINSCKSLFSVFGCPSSVHSDRGLAFTSREYNDFMLQNGIIVTHSTPYHPTGNSQCERANGTIWRAIKLSLDSQDLPEGCWEDVLPTALHSIRSLLCVATNSTPHERMFQFPRKSSSGYSLPTWLNTPNSKVLLRKHVRNKSDPLVDAVELLEANPSFAKVRFPDGRESTVSTGDLADPGERNSSDNDGAENIETLNFKVPSGIPSDYEISTNNDKKINFEGFQQNDQISNPLSQHLSQEESSVAAPDMIRLEGRSAESTPVTIRRSSRLSKPPDRLRY